MVNEEIIGGLVSALSRGEPLEKAMMTFFNAGYKKSEIEVSARQVYNQLGPQVMGIKGSLQETIDEIALKAGVPKDDKSSNDSNQDNLQESSEDVIQLQKPSEKKIPEINIPKKDNKGYQNISSFGQPNYNTQYPNSDELTKKIVSAIKGLKQVNIPSRIEIVHKNADFKPQTVVQRVSDYSSSPKSPSKAVTYILVFILILLLGALAAVFFFKDDLIKLFNNLGFG